MGAVTYPNEKVIEFINRYMIALRIRSDVEPYATRFNVKWTPKVLVLDSDGQEHQSTVGFFPPEDFISSLELGIAKIDFDLGCLEDSKNHLHHILTALPQTSAAPEAMFYNGVVGYKISGKAEPLKEAYENLQHKYPATQWARRAAPYRLL